MAIIMLINLKGGVAKTTSAVAIAECFASQGYRTLLIDADHQCQSGEMLLGEDAQIKCERKKNLYDLLRAMLEPDFRIGQVDSYLTKNVSNINGGLPRLAVLPGNIRMVDFASSMARGRHGQKSNQEYRDFLMKHRRTPLRGWLEQHYDFTIIDCPPSIPLQVRFLLSVADSYIVPCVPDRLSIRGSIHLSDQIRSFGYRIAPLGTLWSLYRKKTIHDQCVVTGAAHGQVRLARMLSLMPKPFKTIIPNATKIAEVPEWWEKSKYPKTFREKYTLEFGKLFENLCEEIIYRSEWQRANPPQPSTLIPA